MKIAIVGTGLIGTSLGLALKAAKVKATVVGTDGSFGTASKAQKRGAFDKTERRLASAVRDAEIVVLAIPVMAMRETMEFIGTELVEGCVVTDTGSTKEAVLSWAEQELPSTVHFVGGHPLVWTVGSGPEYALADLFQGHPYCIVPSRRASESAVGTVAKLAEWVGAKPFFMNADEHDSYAAGVSQLPVLLSAALVRCTSRSPTWEDISKLAEHGYAAFTSLCTSAPDVNRDMCVSNPERTAAWIDRFIQELLEIREVLANGADDVAEQLGKLFSGAWDERLRWTSGRVTRVQGSFEDIPSFGEMALELIIPRKFIERYKKGLQRTKEKEGQ